MEDKSKLVETLLEKAIEYGKSSYNLVKLKAIDETSDRISSVLPNLIVILFCAVVLLFFNLGMAFWIGNLLGESFYGFFIVTAFYIIVALVIHFFLQDWFKKIFYDYIIRKLLNN